MRDVERGGRGGVERSGGVWEERMGGRWMDMVLVGRESVEWKKWVRREDEGVEDVAVFEVRGGVR
ncbi:hypothetical protein, partial [Kocuria rosea]|uniref:hypothetical protein n=1 Tax=Kocuria rosea TaxID=1275 RepID=UPI001C930353